MYEGGVTVSRDFTGAVVASSATMYYIPKTPEGGESGGGGGEGGGGEGGNTGPVDPGRPAWRGTNSCLLYTSSGHSIERPGYDEHKLPRNGMATSS